MRAFIDTAVRDQADAREPLLQHPALREENARSGTALHYLAAERDCGGSVSCTENEFDVNRRNEFRDTPLTIACQLGDSEMIAAMLKISTDNSRFALQIRFGRLQMNNHNEVPVIIRR